MDIQILYNYALAKGNVGCFQFVTITNKVDMNVPVQTLCEHKFPFWRDYYI